MKNTTQCQRPDRHVAGLICGYPLPCPHHTFLVEVRRVRRGMPSVGLLLLFLLPSSCTNFLDQARLPRGDVERVQAASAAAMATPDLDLDGDVNGWDEWEAFVRAFVQAYMEAEKK